MRNIKLKQLLSIVPPLAILTASIVADAIFLAYGKLAPLPPSGFAAALIAAQVMAILLSIVPCMIMGSALSRSLASLSEGLSSLGSRDQGGKPRISPPILEFRRISKSIEAAEGKILSSRAAMEGEKAGIARREEALAALEAQMAAREKALDRRDSSIDRLCTRLDFVLSQQQDLDVYEIDLEDWTIESAAGFKLFADPRLSVSLPFPDLVEGHFERPEGVVEQYRTIAEAALLSGQPIDFRLEHRILDGAGRVRWLRDSGRVIPSLRSIVGTLTDISGEVGRREELVEELKKDELTGLLSRYVFKDACVRRMAERQGLSALLCLDIDGLKEINTRFSHQVGDQVLFAIAQRMLALENEDCMIFRLSGDEIGILLTSLGSAEDSISFVASLARVFEEQISVGRSNFSLRFTCGISFFGRPSASIDEMVDHAEFAMYHATDRIRNGAAFFDPDAYNLHLHKKTRKLEIEKIISANQLYPVYQPIVRISDGHIYGFEALSRSTNSFYPQVTELIEDALEMGHLEQLGRLMFSNCVNGFLSQEHGYRDRRLFVNTTKHGVFNKADVDKLKTQVFSAIDFVVEMTEMQALDETEIARLSDSIRYSGAAIALDDFGSGYANELTLLALKPDIIKLDRELVRNIDSDRRKQLIFRNMVEYARLEGISIVAEGVETEAEFDFVRKAGAHYVQGWYLGRASRNIEDIPAEARQKIWGT